ncbi:MAG: hypothetical protein ACRENG_09960 [bacterium]
MKQPLDLARLFLVVADNDIKAFQKLADDADIADASVGFHAQQAKEIMNAVRQWAEEQVNGPTSS